jgi:cytochrome c biogenesis protein CcmG/thiol:disulfide interchange protein DsbE
MAIPVRALIPLAAFAGLAVLLYVGLSLNPRELPSALLDKPLPQFDLAGLGPDAPRLTSADLADGQVTVLNVFASWCAPCRQEMPILGSLASAKDLRLIGLVYKDQAPATRAFLATYGDPFTRLALDPDGRVGIDLGVYGVPETYVIDGHGLIAFKHVGPLTAESVAQKLRPAIDAAKARSTGGPKK